MTETSFDLANARAQLSRTVGLDASVPISKTPPLYREDWMLSQSKATRIRFVVTLCMVLAGGAVSMGTSCITGPKKAGSGSGGSKTGTINGTVDSSDADPIGSGITVTATDSASGATFVGTTGTNGAYSISDVVAGSGTLVVSGFPSGCTAPATINYTINGGTLTYNIGVPCSITLP
jgi:hypothetical protein